MSETPATLVSGFLGTKISDDGNHLLVGFNQQDQEVAIAIPAETYPEIFHGLMQAYGNLQKAQNERGSSALTQEGQVIASSVEWFDLGQAESGQWILALTIADGPKLHFLLPEGMLEQICESLAAATATTETHEKPSSLN